MSGGAYSTRVNAAAGGGLTGDGIAEQAEHWLEFMGRQLAAFLPIEAPAGDEFERSAWFLQRTHELGYAHAWRDRVGNVLAPFDPNYRGNYLVLDAHMDTAFPRGTPALLVRNGGLWHCPGVYDDGAGLTILLALMKRFKEAPPPGAEKILFCFSVGEEGVGDLLGMRELCARLGGRIAVLYTCDGTFGKESIGAVGSRRFRVTIEGPGGHSWADFGRPSAIHELARWLTQLQDRLNAELAVMAQAHPGQVSSYNIGTIQGGTTVNSIAARAECQIDLRSSQEPALQRMVVAVNQALEQYRWPTGVRREMTVIGDRPTADVMTTTVLRDLRARLHAEFGVSTRETFDSTNANWPLSQGIPATSVGVALGGDAHTAGEWLDTRSLVTGLRFVHHLALRTIQVPALQGRFGP